MVETKASLTVRPGGDAQAEKPDENVLNTNFDQLFLGGQAELGEMGRFYENTKSLKQEQQTFEEMATSVNTAIYYFTKNTMTCILVALAGPILSFCWGIIVAVVKFCVSWVFYPTVKVTWIVCKPTRELVKVLLMPAEPAFELIAHACPQVSFTLVSAKADSQNTTAKET